MSLVLHYAPWSSASTCLWALEELGVPFERVKVELGAGTKTPAFLAMNPNGKVPVLVHDGTPLFESVAILIHLGETFGVEAKRFPAPGIERAKAIQWLVWANVSLGATAGQYLLATSDRVPAERRNAAAGKAADEELRRLLGVLGEALEGRDWLVGDGFTLADLHLSGAVSWIASLGFDPKAYGLDRWLARCQDRPSFGAQAR